MSKVGRIVTDARLSYCRVRLDSGDRLLVSHDTDHRPLGRLSIERSRWLGLMSQRVCTLDLDTVEGRAGLLRVIAAVPQSAQAPALEALVAYVKEASNADDLRQRCDALFPATRVA